MIGAALMSALTWAGVSIDDGGEEPVLASLDYDLADTAGGDTITITGTNLADASSVTVGGTSATITSNTSTEVSFIMPAKSAGLHDVVVTTAEGESNALSIEAWSVTSLSASILVIAPYTPPTWSGTASAGDSGSRSLSEATNPPSPGTELNGRASADFDGTNDQLNHMETTIATLLTASAWSAVVLAELDAVGGSSNQSQGSILTDSGGFWCIGSRNNSGNKVYVSQWDGALKAVELPISTGVPTLIQARFNGSNLGLRTGSGSWSTASSGNISNTTGTLRMGRSYVAPIQFMDGRIWFAMLVPGEALADATFVKIEKWARCRFGL